MAHNSFVEQCNDYDDDDEEERLKSQIELTITKQNQLRIFIVRKFIKLKCNFA